MFLCVIVTALWVSEHKIFTKGKSSLANHVSEFRMLSLFSLTIYSTLICSSFFHSAYLYQFDGHLLMIFLLFEVKAKRWMAVLEAVLTCKFFNVIIFCTMFLIVSFEFWIVDDVLEDAAQTNMMQLIDEHEGVGSSNTMSSLVKDVTSTHCCQCQLLVSDNCCSIWDKT